MKFFISLIILGASSYFHSEIKKSPKLNGFWQETPYNEKGLYFDDSISLCYKRLKSGKRVNSYLWQPDDVVPHITFFNYEVIEDTIRYLDCFSGELKYCILNDTLKIYEDFDGLLDTIVFVKSKDQRTPIYVKSIKKYYP
jgi:hypothetical protein